MKKKVIKAIKEAAKQLPGTTYKTVVGGVEMTLPSNKGRALKKYLKKPENREVLKNLKP